MRTKSNVKPEIKILQVMSVKNELEQYRMPRETGLSYRTVLRTLRPMEKQGAIKLLKTLPSEKGGKEKKIYEITLKGLVHALINTLSKKDPDKKEFEAIIKANSDKLLTFKKWNLFSQNNLGDFMIANLAKALRSEIFETITLSAFGITRSFKSEKDWQTVIDNAILVDPIESDGYLHYGKNYLEVCRQDQELNNFITKAIALRIEQYHQSIKRLEAW